MKGRWGGDAWARALRGYVEGYEGPSVGDRIRGLRFEIRGLRFEGSVVESGEWLILNPRSLRRRNRDATIVDEPTTNGLDVDDIPPLRAGAVAAVAARCAGVAARGSLGRTTSAIWLTVWT